MPALGCDLEYLLQCADRVVDGRAGLAQLAGGRDKRARVRVAVAGKLHAHRRERIERLAASCAASSVGSLPVDMI